MIKIYYAASMRGDRSNLADNKYIVRRLEELGYNILTKHVVEEVLDIERGLTPREVFERDIKLLEEADLVVADVSFPSLGVGFEIAYTLLRGKDVLAICREDRVEKTSSMILGISWNNFKLLPYRAPEDAVEKIHQYILLSREKRE